MARRWIDIAKRLRSYANRLAVLRGTENDIRFAYRLLLGREPDIAGWEALRPLLKSRRLTPPEIAAALMESEEFLQLSGERVEWTEIALPGRRMYVPSNDRDIGSAILQQGHYEPGVEEALRRLLRPGDSFVDIGANLGYFSLLAATLVGADGEVHAIEPMDKNLQCLYSSALSNGFTNLRVYPYAAAESTRILVLTTDSGTSNACYADDADPTDKRAILRTQAIALDTLLIDMQRLDVVKLDVEGMEPQAWTGMERLLSNYQPRVIIEFHPRALQQNGASSPQAFLERLLAYGSASILLDNHPAVACSEMAQVLMWFDPRGNNKSLTHLNLLLEPQSRKRL